MKKIVHVFTVALVAAGLATAAADSPGSFQKTGTLDGLPSSSNKYILISDSSYLVAPGLRVHTPTQDKASLGALKVGQKLEFSVTGGAPGVKDSVSEIWVLPAK